MMGNMESGCLPREELIKTLLDGAIRFYKGLSEAFSDSIVQQYRFKDAYKHLLATKNNVLVNDADKYVMCWCLKIGTSLAFHLRQGLVSLTSEFRKSATFHFLWFD